MTIQVVAQSSKLFEGYSTCFRQWKAEGTHCKYLHGYAVSFRITFQGQLDERNWVFDFGGMKRAKHKIGGMNPLEYFSWLFDHTVVIAHDDPEMDRFKELDKAGLIQLRTLQKTGAEMFATHILASVNSFLKLETEGRVEASKVEFFENGRNSAIAILAEADT